MLAWVVSAGVGGVQDKMSLQRPVATLLGDRELATGDWELPSAPPRYLGGYSVIVGGGVGGGR